MTVVDDALDLFSADGVQDPYPVYERLRAAGPVSRLGGSSFHAVCGWDAVVEAVGRTADFSSNLTAAMVFHDGTLSEQPMIPLGAAAQVLATADDPAHLAHRKILLPHLSARRTGELRDFAAATAERLWDQGIRDGRIEWMSAVADRLPMMVVAELLGVPTGDVDRLIRWGYASAGVLNAIVTPDELAASGTAALELSGYVAGQLDESTADAGLLADLAARCAGGELDRLTALAMMVTLFSAAGESTASLLGSAVRILTQLPDIQRQVRDDRSLLGPFVEETLRFEPPFRGHYRHVLADTTLAGTALSAGSHLLLLWGAANRDPAEFAAPHEFRLDRPAARNHLAFGRGTHFCVGASLARMEALAVLDMLLDRTTWIEATAVGPWLPSILVRRVRYLQLSVG
ncbi:cytochrome P450 [Nocardia aurantia]|uniref:Cytochrome P450 144 n=1 Tax=Nocardia aurantia TaxID=2585199 RepID=A0A7K0DNM1_9NOCA|nr:cytochrome P450 [Nocardia aurantia]MQY27340.1 Cytochrome P450 144 [Nocardia aurantia]